jgi:hypothetical protein
MIGAYRNHPYTYYHDDPSSGSDNFWRSAFSPGKMLVILLLGMSFFLQATYSANINLTSVQPVEFGQGVQVLGACSSATSISLKPNAVFINASGGGDFYVGSVTVSGIPSQCADVDLELSAYDKINNSPVALYADSSTAVRVYSSGTDFSLIANQSGVTLANQIGGFTVTFQKPAALSANAYNFTIQSAKGTPRCSVGGPCSVGDRGPGGGIVFYSTYANGTPGFNCGPTFSSTGSPNGGLCHYLEAAPASWANRLFNTTYVDPEVFLVPSAYYAVDVPTIPNETSAVSSSSQIGLGYFNSLAFITAFATCPCSQGLWDVRQYAGNGYRDWYVPTFSELVQLVKWLRMNPWTSDATFPGAYVGRPAESDFSVYDGGDCYWSSTEYSPQQAHYMCWYSYFYRTATKGTSKLKIRPIRAF